jgi:hypothetical protein
MHVESRSCASFHFEVPFSSSKSPRIKETMLIAFIQFILWSLLRNRLRDLSTRTTKEVLGRNRQGSHSTQGENQGLAAAPMRQHGTCGILWLAAPCWYHQYPCLEDPVEPQQFVTGLGPLDLRVCSGGTATHWTRQGNGMIHRNRPRTRHGRYPGKIPSGCSDAELWHWKSWCTAWGLSHALLLYYHCHRLTGHGRSKLDSGASINESWHIMTYHDISWHIMT